jgi:uncharacterized protein (TIGR00725 family)
VDQERIGVSLNRRVKIELAKTHKDVPAKQCIGFDKEAIALQIAVVGGGECSPNVEEQARRLGRLLAEAGHVILCGGRGGVMEAVSAGAREAGGLVVGILPGERSEGNPHLGISIATGMGHARNAIIVKSADAVIALPGEYGTLSEMALALKMGRPVISLQSWEVPGTRKAESPEDAAEILNDLL